MAELAVLSGPDAGRVFELAGETILVGRLSTNPVCLADLRTSRRHFELQVKGSQIRLVDLGSGNGTRVNGAAVHNAELRPGDKIELGDTVLEFRADPPSNSDRTRLVVRTAGDAPSAIVHRVPADAGSAILRKPEQTESDWLKVRLANLAALYEASAATSTILDPDELLGRIAELVRRSTDADHACTLLLDAESGLLLPGPVRARHGGGELVVSRTVVDAVLKSREGLLLRDAKSDERFRDGASIVRHKLREVICVPMQGRHETVGALFLDAAAEGTFTEDHLQFAVAVAHQAALAVEETHYYLARIQAERLAAVGQAIAGLSHHIKNIMQGVRFGSDLVRGGLDSSDREMLEKGWNLVEKNQKRIDDLILDMLSYSKEREPILEATDLAGVVREAVEVVSGRAAEAGVTIDCQFGALPPVQLDSEGIHRAVLNLLGNAIDALNGTDNPRLDLTLEVADGYAELRIRDNGPGVPPELHDEIFKPFVSSKGSRGTGLGLPASRKTLREHGGDLLVETTDGAGATFLFRLPMKG